MHVHKAIKPIWQTHAYNSSTGRRMGIRTFTINYLLTVGGLKMFSLTSEYKKTHPVCSCHHKVDVPLRRHQKIERQKLRSALSGYEQRVWIRIELWNTEIASFFPAHLSRLKVYLCIFTLDLVTSSLPWGHRIYKWIGTLNRISPCTQAATLKESSADDLWSFLVWMSSLQNIRCIYR